MMSEEAPAAVVPDPSDSMTSQSSPPAIRKQQLLLCGYLNKMSGKGPLRGFKKRWFIHSNSDCKLKYYRAKGDLVPLGEIDVRRATFSISPAAGQSSSSCSSSSSPSLIFTITTLDKEYMMEGSDQETTLFWIRELQRLRKEYIVHLASDFGIKLTSSNLDDGVNEPMITEIKCNRSNSRFYVEEDLAHELNQNTTATPKRSVTDDALSHRQSRSSVPAPSGFTSSLFSRVRHRAESLTRGNSHSKNGMCEKCREKEDQMVSTSLLTVSSCFHLPICLLSKTDHTLRRPDSGGERVAGNERGGAPAAATAGRDPEREEQVAGDREAERAGQQCNRSSLIHPLRTGAGSR